MPDTIVDLGQRAPPARRKEERQAVGSKDDLLLPVAIEVGDLPLDPRPVSTDGSIELRFARQDLPVDGIAKVRQVEPAEDAVPVCAVALRPPEVIADLRRFGGTKPFGPVQRLVREEGPLVHAARLRIADEEVPEEAAPKKKPFRLAPAGVAKEVLGLIEEDLRVRRQSPLGHLAVRSRR